MEAHSNAYPAGALVRVKDICGDRKAGRPGLLPINPSTWYDWVKEGRVQPGQKIGENTTVWPVEAVLSIGEVASAGGPSRLRRARTSRAEAPA